MRLLDQPRPYRHILANRPPGNVKGAVGFDDEIKRGALLKYFIVVECDRQLRPFKCAGEFEERKNLAAEARHGEGKYRVESQEKNTNPERALHKIAGERKPEG